MNEDAGFWEIVKRGAANLNLAVLVAHDAKMTIRHLKSPDEPGRPSDKDLDTFRQFLSRNRDRILRANHVEEGPGVAQDARRLKAWLESHAEAADCLLDGVDFHGNRQRLLRTYREDGAWVLGAAIFHKEVVGAKSWELQ